MPKLCDGCGYYSASNEPTTCPECSGALKITFLPPAGKKAAPLAGVATDPLQELERRKRAAGGSGINWMLVKAIGVGLFTVAGIGLRFYFRQQARDEREERQTASLDKIRPGMHISEAARLLNAASNMPKWRGSTQRNPDDYGPNGSLEVSDGWNDLTITWENWRVTSVERCDESGRVHRETWAPTADPDDDDEDEGVTDPQTGEVTYPSKEKIARPRGGR